MKRLFTLLATVMALFAITQKVMAEDVYLLTEQTLNGVTGNYNNPPSSHQMTLYNSANQEYKIRITDMPSGSFSFRVGVKGWGADMQSYNDGDQLQINEVGSTPVKYNITDKCYGKNKAWKVTNYSAYDYLDVIVSIGSSRYVYVVGGKYEEQNLYLLTSQNVNGTTGTYDMQNLKSEHKFTLKEGSRSVYQYAINTDNSGDAPLYFRLGVSGWTDNNQMQPYKNDDPLTIYSEGTLAAGYKITNDCYFGNKAGQTGKAWKLDYDAATYEQLIVNVDLSDGANRRVWVEGKKQNDQSIFTLISSGAEYASNKTGKFTYNLADATNDAVVSFKIGTDSYGLSADATISDEGTTKYTATKDATGTLTLTKGYTYTITINGEGAVEVVAKKQGQYVTSDAGYYLVGNFFSPFNKEVVTPGPDGDNINYNKLYFKFEQQTDGSYSFNIPACLTAKMQILAVNADGSRTVYAPDNNGATYDLHGTWPKTGETAPSNDEDKPGTLVGSSDISEAANYWTLRTRNNSQIETDLPDDDGMYTVRFTLGADGKPSKWTIKHDTKTRVAYLLSTAYGATAQPIYNARKSEIGAYDDNTKAALHFDGKNSYYAIGYVVSDANYGTAQYEQAKGATSGIHPTKSVNNGSGTHDKLFFLGNGGYEYNDSEHNKVWVNQKPFTLNISGTKVIEYNPNRGFNDLAATDGTYGSTGSIYIQNANTVDYPSAISMVGDAISGTTDGTEWNWASTAADMTYDANDRCYKLTISTTDADYGKGFRFVGDHSQKNNWCEDSETQGTMTAKTKTNTVGHTCESTDPNYLSYTYNGDTEYTDHNRDIIWNKEAGLWTVRFYIYTKTGTDGKTTTEYRYTIEGTENQPLPFTYRCNKFIRSYSNSKAMDVVSPNVKVYEAYEYKKPENTDDIYSQGTLKMRRLSYIPANMGVVLIGLAPSDGNFSDGAKMNFSLRERTEESATTAAEYKAVWTKADSYTADEWNNFLAPTVEANNNLGNAEEENGVITYRYFGLGNFYRTAYYAENQTGDDYIGFFRLTANGRSGANKAYLRIPASESVEGGKFGYIDYNGQFIGDETDDAEQASLAKMQLAFDDEMGGVTEISGIKADRKADNAYYNLQGMRVMHPTKGIYIHGGKKVVVK